MQATVGWTFPKLLPERLDVQSTQSVSAEASLLNDRMNSVLKASYRSDFDVPNSPTPLSDVEQALDMTSQASAVVETIPFFVPQVGAPVDPASSFAATTTPMSIQLAPSPYIPSSVMEPGNGATPEYLQALGLPLFLVGFDANAIHTLASSPGLLSTLVDANGMYDQARLISLVQTLSGTNTGAAPPSSHLSQMSGYQSGPSGVYGAGASSAYGQQQLLQAGPPPVRNGFRNNSSEGNLHISGYGPSTTEAEIISLFLPYVRVDEVVMKGTFAFVNTSDSDGAQRAREALNGALLGGMPVRINPAQRKLSGSVPSSSYGDHGASTMSAYGPTSQNQSSQNASAFSNPIPTINVDTARDDRGNPATKNLFVAGYGPGTTEQQIRDLFGQHATVVGVVLKQSFSFVNTGSREDAIRARQHLSGSSLNGGVMRINFAKETGRLGTSFDLTYNARSSLNYYGRDSR